MKQFFLLALLSAFVTISYAQSSGTVKYYTKVSAADTSLGHTNAWQLGVGLCMLHDLDGDGVNEIVAGSQDGYKGYLYVMRMDTSGQVKLYTTIIPDSFGINNDNFDEFGRAVADIGDLDGNGTHDLVVGNPTGRGYGEIFILFLNAAAQVDSFKEIYSFHNGFNYSLDGQYFGGSVACIGDLDSDGVADLAIGNGSGALWVLFMKKDGTVKNAHEITNGTGDLPYISPYYSFGLSVSSLGDLDKDGHNDVIVESFGDSTYRGDAWTLFLNSDGTVKNYYHYVPGTATFPDTLNMYSNFGYGVANIGDIDGDSVTDIAMPADGYIDSLGHKTGRVWICFLNTDGSIKATQIIDKNYGNFTAPLNNGDYFGSATAAIGDFNKDGIYDLCVAAAGDDDANPSDPSTNSGAFYFLYLNGIPVVTGVGDVIENKATQFYAYPNPASDHLIIRSKDQNKLIRSLTIVDLSGHIVCSQNINKNSISIDIQNLAEGTYFINLTAGTQTESIHFVKR